MVSKRVVILSVLCQARVLSFRPASTAAESRLHTQNSSWGAWQGVGLLLDPGVGFVLVRLH